LGGDTDVFQRGGVRQDVGDLVGTCDALARDAVRGQPRDVLALEQDAARGGPQNAGQAIEEGAFARAVRPDDGADFITPDLEVDAIERRQAAEADRPLSRGRGSNEIESPPSSCPRLSRASTSFLPQRSK